MWTTSNRGIYDRSELRYPSDLDDSEWEIVAPMIPPAKRGGRPRTVNIREVLNGIFYVLTTGCQWRAVPKDLPAASTLRDYLDLWDWDGTLERIHHALFVEVREGSGIRRRGGVPRVRSLVLVRVGSMTMLATCRSRDFPDGPSQPPKTIA